MDVLKQQLFHIAVLAVAHVNCMAYAAIVRRHQFKLCSDTVHCEQQLAFEKLCQVTGLLTLKCIGNAQDLGKGHDSERNTRRPVSPLYLKISRC